jgi:hypothetical protein
MIRMSLSAAFIGISLAASLGAQSSAPNPAPASAATHAPDPGARKTPSVLTGCLTSPQPGAFVVRDEKQGVFALLGQRLDIYIGKKIEVRGGDQPGGLHITTGLYPSPNIAAQAGAIDPVKAAQAAMPGGGANGTGPSALPTFAVTKIKTMKGACK